MFMKEIKSNPSHVVKVYVENTKRVVNVVSDNYTKDIRIVDIPIMDRYSNGSYVIKDKIKNCYLEVENISREEFDALEYKEEKRVEPAQISFDMLNQQSLKEVDDRMVIINNFLDNVEGK